MRRIYATLLHFDGPADVAAPRARAFVRQWCSSEWGGWPAHLPAVEGTTQPTPDGTARWRTLEGDASRLWQLVVEEPFPDDSSLRQETHVDIWSEEGSAHAYVEVSLRSVDPAMRGAVVYENAAPEIVATLVEQVGCTDAGRRLSAQAWQVHRKQVRELATLVADHKRRLPVVLFVAGATFAEERADEVAEALAGLAHVAVVPAESVGAITEEETLAVLPGASAYLWWAISPTRHDEGRRRRPQTFRSDALGSSFWGVPAWPVVRTIYGGAAFRLSPPVLLGRLEAEATRRRIRDLEVKARAPEADAELLRAWEADLVALESVQRISAELETENERLQADLNAVIGTFERAVRAAAEARPERCLPEARTLFEAVQIAKGMCCHLRFLPEADESARTWQFARPEVVLEALLTLDDLAGRWRDGDLDSGFMAAALAAGLPWKPAISQTARTRYRDDYVRRLDDHEIMLSPHLSWGVRADNAVRVYLHLDRETRTVVVGHVGRHLRDTTNQHL